MMEKGQKVALLAIGVNLVLFGLKYTFATLSGSIALDYQTLSLAEKLILSEPQVIEMQNLMGRNSGRYKFIEASIILKTHDLDKANFIAHRIESNIKMQIKNSDCKSIYACRTW